MHGRNIKNKYVSLLSLVAFLFATTCFVPCGMPEADATPHHSSGEMQGEMHSEVKGHSCHSESTGNFLEATKSEGPCVHCAIVQSTAFQERVSLVDHAQASIVAFSDSYFVSQYFSSPEFVDKSSPPGSDQPIYILNSTFII